MDQGIYNSCVAILREELLPALGCTEPIAVAYAAALARQALGCMPEGMTIECSGNIIKNVKGVIVPTTQDLRGTCAAAILGAVGGDPSQGLEVLTSVTPQDVETTRRLLREGLCEEKLLDTPAKLHIIVHMQTGAHTALAEIIHTHANLVRLEKDGCRLVDIPYTLEEVETGTDKSCLSIQNILAFVEEVRIEDVKEILDRQIRCNTAISQEGLTHPYGAQVGLTLKEMYGLEDIKIRAKAAAAAGSDARMAGCELPVVINSGSGNQGLTACLPVVEYAKELGADDDKLYRALCLSNLVAIHEKAGIGRLSAFCGAVGAATGAGAAICYLMGGSEEQIGQTIVNSLGNAGGIVCDGAKSSCGAKISSALDCAILSAHMALKGRGFRSGEGIVKDTVEETVSSVAQLARDGMRETDLEILRIMIG